MTQPERLAAAAAAIAILVSACGGTAAPSPSVTVAPTVAATVAPTATPIPTLARVVVPATGQGSTSAKLAESKLTLADPAPTLPVGSYLYTVSMVTLEKGGRTIAHKHGGIESIYVLDGTIDFRWQNGGRVILKSGQGAAIPAGTSLQAVNAGDGAAKFIAFFLTAEAAPFQTNVDEAP